MNSTEQTIFKEKKGISFEVLWKKHLPNHFKRKLGKWGIQEFQYLLGFNLAVFDIILIGGALNGRHFSLCILNFCLRIRWSSPEYKMSPMPKKRQKVTPLTLGRKRKRRKK